MVAVYTYSIVSLAFHEQNGNNKLRTLQEMPMRPRRGQKPQLDIMTRGQGAPCEQQCYGQRYSRSVTVNVGSYLPAETSRLKHKEVEPFTQMTFQHTEGTLTGGRELKDC